MYESAQRNSNYVVQLLSPNGNNCHQIAIKTTNFVLSFYLCNDFPLFFSFLRSYIVLIISNFVFLYSYSLWLFLDLVFQKNFDFVPYRYAFVDSILLFLNLVFSISTDLYFYWFVIVAPKILIY